MHLFIWVMSLKILVSRSHTVAMTQNTQVLRIRILEISLNNNHVQSSLGATATVSQDACVALNADDQADVP